jgi:quercetin dioxygenase-like cupin family protein
MQRVSVLLPVLALVLAGSVALGRASSPAVAEDATPPGAPAAEVNLTIGQLAPIGQPFEPVPGVELEILNEGQPANAPGLSLVLYRITFRDGEATAHTHPGSTLASVESGTLSWTLLAGTVWVTRPGQAREAVTASGTELVLNPGEGLFYNDDIVHSAKAAGAEPAVALVTVLFEVGQPFLTFTNEQGTPVAAGMPGA